MKKPKLQNHIGPLWKKNLKGKNQCYNISCKKYLLALTISKFPSFCREIYILLLCIFSFQNHGSPQFPFLWSLKQSLSPFSLPVFFPHPFTQTHYGYNSLFLVLPQLSCIKFSKPSFHIMCPRNSSGLFLVLRINLFCLHFLWNYLFAHMIHPFTRFLHHMELYTKHKNTVLSKFVTNYQDTKMPVLYKV